MNRQRRCAECGKAILPALLVTFNRQNLHPVRCFDAALAKFRRHVDEQLAAIEALRPRKGDRT